MRQITLLLIIVLLFVINTLCVSSYLIVPKSAVVNEPFEIQIFGSGSLRIETLQASYRQIGFANESVFFTPQNSGLHTIILLNSQGTQIAAVNITITEQITPIQPTKLSSAISSNSMLHTKTTSLPAQVKVLNGTTVLLDRPANEIAQGVQALKLHKATVEIEPYTKGFKKLRLHNVNPAQIDIGFDIPEKRNIKIPQSAIYDTFAIDPSKTNFSYAELTRVATGTTLYKCADWNFTQSRCLGTWKKIMDLTPGAEYTLLIDPADPGFAETGVATINSLKPIYEPYETAQFVMAILDTQGYLVSDANITVIITSPANTTTILSSPSDIFMTSKGIYEASLLLGNQQGDYQIEIISVAQDVNTTMFSSFVVAQNYAYDILRQAPVSIDPWSGSFQSSIRVLAHNATWQPIDVIETLPLDYIVTQSIGATQQLSNTSHTLTWQNILPGTVLNYSVQAPLFTPDIDVLGELLVISANGSQFEARPWFIAVDPSETLSPVVHVNTELDGSDLTSGQVTSISSDDTSYVTFGKSITLTVEVSNPTNSTPIQTVNSLSCSVRYTSEDYSPDATFTVNDAFGGNQLGTTTLAPSVGSDATVALSNLQLDSDFQITDLQTLNILITNNDGGKSQSISIDRVWCSVDYTLLDIQSPTVTLNAPTEKRYTSSATVVFNYTAIDNRNFRNCSLYIDATFAQVNSSPIINNSINSFTRTISQGTHNWSVRCFDLTANQGNSGTRNFTIDTTNPTAFSLLTPANATVSNDLTPQFNWSATTEVNFKNYTLQVDDNSDFSSPNYIRYNYNTPLNNSFQFVTIIGANTQYYWRVTAYDLAKRSTQSSQSYTYITDTLAPSAFTATAPANNTVSANRTPTINWTTTTEANFANYTILFDNNANFLSPEHKYVVTSRTTTSYSIQSFEQLNANTRFFWRITAYDRAGQSRNTLTRIYQTDNNPPYITLSTPSNLSTESITNVLQFNYTVSDAVSNVASCDLIINGSTAQSDVTITENTTQTFNQFLANGDYSWRINCIDSKGNTNSSLTRLLAVNVLVDTTPPTITLNKPLNNSYSKTASVLFNYTPNDASGIASCSILLNGSTIQTNTSILSGQANYFTLTSLSDTSYSWRISCIDNSTSSNAGNSLNRILRVDTTNPTAFTLSQPTDTLRTKQAWQAFDWTSTVDANFRNYTLLLDDDSNFASPNYRFFTYSIATSNYTSSPLADNTYYWRVIAYDQATNARNSTQTYSFEIDTLAPILENLTENPADPVQYSPTRTYNFTVDVAGSDLSNVRFQNTFAGTATNYTPNGSVSNKYHYTVSKLNVGSYTYRWHANDTLNNKNFTSQSTYIITKNLTTMGMTLDGLTANKIINESKLLNITATLNYPSGATVSIRRNGTLLNQSTSPLSILRNFSTPGNFRINASYAGNSNYAYSQRILNLTVRDNIAPKVRLISPANVSTDIDGIISYAYNVTDSAAVSSCTLYVGGVANGTTNNPTKATQLTFQRTYYANVNITWQVRCTDAAGHIGNSSRYNITVQISTLIRNLVPRQCVEETSGGGCTALNVNLSDATYEDHNGLTKNQFNYVNVSLWPAAIPAGATILNVSVLWDKYQATNVGTFFIYWRNGTNWQQICNQALTTSSTGTPDEVNCNLLAIPNRTQLNNGISLRGGWSYGNGPNGAAYGTDFVRLSVTYQEDVTDPVVTLNDPVDAIALGEGPVMFNFTATDINLENCTLYGDFNGTFLPNQTITVADTLVNGVQSSFVPVNLSVGYYRWNVLCYDIAANSAFAAANNTINITPPDLTTQSQYITFSNYDPLENENVTINATIFNNGLTATTSFAVQFFLGNPDMGGTQINSDLVVSSIDGLSNTTLGVTYLTKSGANNIYVKIDSNNEIDELSETNNLANNTLFVDSYFTLYGLASANISLDTQSNSSLYMFMTDNDATGNIFFARAGTVPSFLDLQALGVNDQGDNTSDDFEEADILLNMTGANDSINKIWANESNRPLLTATFSIYGNGVPFVPIIYSDSSGNFTTGILWDTSQDTGDTQYSLADSEALVFVTQINVNANSDYGVQDYVAKVPALLRSYDSQPSSAINLYVEIT